MGAPSFDEVYAACQRSVLALCRGLTGNDADAKDAFQETFLAVATALPRFRGECAVKTWVHRIAIRTAVRARGRRRNHEELDDAAVSRDGVRTRRLEVARAMEALSAEHRLVLALFAVEGMTHPEIAETLGIPEGTVWSRLHAAKKKLAAALGDLTPAPVAVTG